MLGLMMLCVAQGCPPPATGGDTGGDTTGGTGGTVIEPDDFEPGTALTNVNPTFTLTTALEDNEIAELFKITATDIGEDLAPTGEYAFGHSNIGFFNEFRRLRIDFVTSGSSIQITFGGGTFSQTEIGVLQAYDATDNLIAEYTTAPLEEGESEVMTVSAAGIAWAVAYTQEGGSFGRLDRLVVGAN
jgi:hypothetical protein